MNTQGLVATLTVQFRVGDISFWRNCSILPQKSPITLLQQDNIATINITYKNNRHRVHLVHQEDLTNGQPYLAKELAEQVHHILSNGRTNDNNIAVVYNNGKKEGINPPQISKTIKSSVRTLVLEKQGIMEYMVNTHSLWAIGVMELNMSVNIDILIMKFGWWSSLTFLQYIHEKIYNLSKGVSTDMSNQIPFNKIGAIVC